MGKRPTHNERVLLLLSDGKPHTHTEIYALGVVAHSRVSALRAKGYTIPSWREGDLYLYQLTGSPLGEPSVVADRASGVVLRETFTDGSPSGDSTSSPGASGLSDGDTAAVAAQQLSVYDALGEAA